ncbi:MAG: hypothetical protein QOF51_333 [Chloroflexota bacterium]|jgi:hypothetical protein|nr:hypothetical protein [Chloroflexota bacterium]
MIGNIGEVGLSPLPCLRLTMNAIQSIPDTTATKLSFDTVSFAGNGWTAPVAPVTDITLPFSGIVLVTAYDMDWGDASSGAGIRQLFTRANDGVGSTRVAVGGPPSLAATALKTIQSFSRVMKFVAGDTMQIYAKQTSGGALSVAMDDVFLQYLQLGTFTFSGTN